jgi:hypothetical protein
VLEEIRLLLNFESDTAKHLQIVLTGQPELRDRLNQPNLRQFKQRVALRCNMHAFPNVEEVDRYISERLLIAGSDNPSVFTPEAVDYIFRCSEGIPRNINNLCDNAMLAAYSAGQQLIGRGIVEEVAEGLDMLPRHELTKIAEAAQDQLGVPGRIMKPESMDDLSTGRERHEAIKPREFAPDPPKNANGNGNGHATTAVPQVKIQQPAQGNGNGNRNGNGNGNGHHTNNGVKPYRPLEDDEILLEIDGVPTRYKKI